MATAAIPALKPHTQSPAQTLASTQPIPWYLYSLTFALLLVTTGGQADVSWHRTIGRDTFWTPPHMMVYACGIIAGLTCAFIILSTTFNPRSPLRPISVSILGLRAPLGIFVTAWGGLMMLYSAPVDNWWHNAYGLDVRIISPPHILLLAGTWSVALGTLLLAAAQMNRAAIQSGAPSFESHPKGGVSSEARPSYHLAPYQNLFLFIAALAVIHLMSYSMGYTFDTHLHTAKPYIVMATGVPFALAAFATAARRRWAATSIAAVYTAFMLLTIWILQLIPATPHLGPVYQTITHLIPPKFPILLIIPAVALDLIRQHTPNLRPILRTILSGTAWLTLLVAAQWPFASFLMSPYARNPFFATGPGFLDFSTPPDSPDALRLFESPQHGVHLLAGLLLATILSIAAIQIGTKTGRYLHKILR